MSYRPYDRNPSGIVFFGTQTTDPTFDSSSNFVVDQTNSRLVTPNLLLSNNGKIGSQGKSDILTLGADGVATFASGVIIDGDLVVNGTQVILNTEVVEIEDNIIVLNSNSTGSPVADAGVEIKRGSSPSVQLLWDEGIDKWTFTNNGTNYFEIVGHSLTQTLTNKTISGSNNTFTNIPNNALVNDGVTVTAGTGLSGGGEVKLGSSITVNIGAGNGISASTTGIAVNPGSGIIVDSLGVHAKAGSGIAVDNNGIHVVESVISGRAELTSANLDDTDQFLVLDSDSNQLRRITKANLLGGLGAGTVTSVAVSGQNGINVVSGSPVTSSGTIVLGLSNIPNSSLQNSSITFSDGSVTSSIALGQTFTLDGGTGIDVDITSSTATFTLDLNELPATGIANGDSIVFVDASDSNKSKKDTLANLATFFAGNGLSATNSVLAVNVDNSTIEIDTDTLRLKDNGVTNAKLRDSAGLSVIGRSANTTGDPADITAATDHHVLRRSGTALGFGLIVNNNIDGAAAINFSKLENGTALSVLGRSANTNGAVASIVAGTDGHVLRRSGTAVGFGTIASAGIADGAVTEAKRSRTVATINSSVTMSSDINLVTSGSGGVTVTLPAASTGRVIRIKKVDSGAGFVTISGGAATIDGASTKALYYQYESMTLASDGTNWFAV